LFDLIGDYSCNLQDGQPPDTSEGYFNTLRFSIDSFKYVNLDAVNQKFIITFRKMWLSCKYDRFSGVVAAAKSPSDHNSNAVAFAENIFLGRFRNYDLELISRIQ